MDQDSFQLSIYYSCCAAFIFMIGPVTGAPGKASSFQRNHGKERGERFCILGTFKPGMVVQAVSHKMKNREFMSTLGYLMIT